MDENGTTPAMRSAFQPLLVENIETDGKSARQRAVEVDYTPEYDSPPSRQPAEDREDAFSISSWMLQGVMGLVEEIQHNDFGLSEEFWIHAYAAQREGKMALDLALEEIQKRATAGRQAKEELEQRRERRGGIDIDF